MVFQRLKSLFSVSKADNYQPVEGIYAVGEIYGFKVEPCYEFKNEPTGRFGAVKFLGVKPTKLGEREETLECFAVLDGVFEAMPTAGQVRTLPALRQNRFSYDGSYAAGRIRKDTKNTLSEFTFITRVDITDVDRAVLDEITSWSGLGAANTNAELEWHWRHDREQLILDNQRAQVEEKQRLEEYEKQRKQHLASLSYGKFINQSVFEGWRSDLTDTIVDHLDKFYADAATSLQRLGPNPRRGDARKVLQGLVEELNDLNLQNDGFIETLHREQLCERISDLAHLAKQTKLIAEVDDWRDW